MFRWRNRQRSSSSSPHRRAELVERPSRADNTPRRLEVWRSRHSSMARLENMWWDWSEV